MVKLSTIFECFLGIVLIISVVLFTGGIIAHRSTIDAVPVLSNDVQTDLSSPDVDVPETQTQPAQEAVSEPEPEPESMTFVSSYTPPVYNRGGRNKIADNVQAQVDDSGSARVIVTLSDSGKKNEVLSQLKSFDKQVDMKNGFAGYVDEEDLGTLESNEYVLGVDEDFPLAVANAESFPLINADKASSASFNGFANLTGAGQTVCIIDTGVDYTHDDLGNCTGTQYLNNNCPKFADRGYDFYLDTPDAGDPNGHGTSIAGIIAGNGPGYKGLAPYAKIIPLKVTDDLGNSWASLVDEAVTWCVDNASAYNITVISVALSSAATTNQTDLCNSGAMADSINYAVANNLTVFAPTGNSESITGISSPACITNVTSVSAVADGSGLTAADLIPNSTTDVWGPNRYPVITDLMAPGSDIDSIWSGDLYGTFAGTSYASAHAVGSAILLREFYQEKYGKTLTPAEIKEYFVNTGVSIWDSNTSANYPRIDLLGAVKYAENQVYLDCDSDDSIYEGQYYSFGCDFENEGVNDNRNYTAQVTNLDSADHLVINQTSFTNIDSNDGGFFTVELGDADPGNYTATVKVYDNQENIFFDEVNITVEVVPKPNIALNSPTNSSTITVDNAVMDLTIDDNVTCKFTLDTTTLYTRIYFDASGEEADLRLHNIDGEDVGIDYYYNGSSIEFGMGEYPDETYLAADGVCQGDPDVTDCEGLRILKVESDGTAHELEIRYIDDFADEVEIEDIGSGMNYVKTYTPEQVSTLALGSYNLKLNVSEAAGKITASEVNEYAPYSFKGEYSSNITLLGSTGINITSPADSLDFTWYYDTFDIVATESEILDDIATDVYTYYDAGGYIGEAGFTDYGAFVRYASDMESVWIGYPESYIADKDVLNKADNTYSMTGLSDGQHNISLLCNDYPYDFVFTVDTSGDTTPPVISNIVNNSITNQSADVEWDTDELSNSSVNYGLTASLGTEAGSDTDVIGHQVTLLNLQANTTYYYNVTSCDASDNCATEGPHSFTTDANIADTTPPTVSLNSPPDGSNDSDGNVTIEFGVSDDMASSLTCDIYSNTSGAWQVDDTRVISNATSQLHTYYNLSDGEYVWNMECDDGSNTAFAPANYTFIVNTTIVDLIPPNVTLEFPLDSGIDADGNVTFQWTVSDDLAIDLSCEFWNNGSGTWQVERTFPSVANGNTISFDESFIDGDYIWNVACNDGTNTAFAPANYTFTVNTTVVDSVPPNVTLVYPDSITDPDGSVGFKFNVTDDMASTLDCTFWSNQTGTWQAHPTWNFPSLANGSEISFSEPFDDGDYIWNVGCDDGTNVGFAPANYTFTVLDTTPPAGITGLSSTSKSTDWIYWEWTNPADSDFAENIIFIEGTNVANTSDNFYNATGLTQNTNYTITVHTKDTHNNINSTNVSDTVSTDEIILLPDLVIDSSRVYTQTPTAGAWTTFEILVKNIGDVAAIGVHWLFDTDYTSPENISFGPFNIAVNETVKIYPAVLYNTTGTFNTVFTVDINDTITEYNETNNQAAIPVNVS